MKLSNKKKDELYGVVHEEVMQARIKLCKAIPDKKTFEIIDEVMFVLIKMAPLAAINVFKQKRNENKEHKK